MFRSFIRVLSEIVTRVYLDECAIYRSLSLSLSLSLSISLALSLSLSLSLDLLCKQI